MSDSLGNDTPDTESPHPSSSFSEEEEADLNAVRRSLAQLCYLGVFYGSMCAAFGFVVCMVKGDRSGAGIILIATIIYDWALSYMRRRLIDACTPGKH